MADKELDDYMKTVNPNFNSHIEKGTIEMSNEYYNLLEEKIARLINQNKELKKQLEVGEQQYNDLVEEKEKLDIENQVLKDYKNIALSYMKNYLKMELRYQNKDVSNHFKMVIDMLNGGNNEKES